MTYSDQCVNLVKEFEGCVLRAYRDAVGVWTIGFGSTGPDVHEGLQVTQERADELLREDLDKADADVNRLVRVATTQGEHDALVDFVFNMGAGALGYSHLLQYVNSGDMKAAAGQFRLWNHAGGKELMGLTRRRLAEEKLFVS